MEKQIERGRGLITQILQREPPRKLDQPVYRLNPAALETPSDFAYAATLERLGKRGNLTRAETRELRGAVRMLTKRGKLAYVTTEDS